MPETDPRFKEVILQRAVHANQFKVGDRVKIKRSAIRGNVVDIIEDEKEVNWVGNIPQFIKVNFDGVIQSCHYSKLKRSKI